MNYFVSKLFDDVIFRYNEQANELELYIGNGEWKIKEGMFAEFLTGIHSSVWAIGAETALNIIKIVDKRFNNQS